MPWDTSDRRSRLPPNWDTTRRLVLERDRNTCRLAYPDRCITRATEVDHVNRGDDHTPANLQAACQPCHAHKSALEGATARQRHRTKRPTPRHPGLA